MRQPIDEPNEVVVAEMCPTSSDNHGRIRGTKVRPLLGEPPELSRLVVEEHAVLTPRLPALDYLENAAMEWMEGMRNAKALRRTACQRCN
jgi:hypothetical protein